MKITLYQIDMSKDKNRVCFFGIDAAIRFAGGVDREIYAPVFTGDVPCDDDTVEASLENVYRKFNLDRPEDYTGRSLSVSDVVVIHGADGARAWFCDSVGFVRIGGEWA